MKQQLFLVAIATLFFLSCEQEALVSLPAPEPMLAQPVSTAYTQVDPVSNEAYSKNDVVEVSYNEQVARFQSPYPLSGFRLLNTFDCENPILSQTYSRTGISYSCDITFTEAFITCIKEERGPDGFFMAIDYAYTVSLRESGDEFGGWRHFIDSVGSKLDGMEIQGQYINIEGTPALGVVRVGSCKSESMYFDWLPKSGEPSHLRQQNYMRSCTGVFEAEVNLDKKELDFTHDTNRELIAQPVVFMSGDVLHISDDFYSSNGRGISATFSEEILAAMNNTGYLFFAVGHE